MSSPLSLRSYQEELLRAAVNENVIINLPTGGGKTLIAVHLIDHMLNCYPDRKILFVVPTKALVTQQASYIKTHFSKDKERVQEFSGPKYETWVYEHWEKCIRNLSILVGTPEIFRRALDSNYLSPYYFSLIVFDECHHCIKNHPMVSIMNRFWEAGLSDVKVCGLTASFANVSIKNDAEIKLMKIKQTLQDTMRARLISPQNFQEKNRTFEGITVVNCVNEDTKQLIEDAETFINNVTRNLDERTKKSELIKLFKNAATHILEELGPRGFELFYYNCFLAQAQEKISSSSDYTSTCRMEREMNAFYNLILSDYFHIEMDKFREKHKNTTSTKYKKLVELIQEQANRSKGIIFVERVCLAFPLSILLKQDFPDVHDIYPVTGGGAMCDSRRNTNLDQFRASYQMAILVATSAIEEGLDVPDCEWVIRYNAFHTTRSHIQGTGRARKDNARIYYLDNDPEKEKAYQAALNHVAKQDIEPSYEDSEVIKNRFELSRMLYNYPYSSNSNCRLDVANVTAVVQEYIAKVLKSSVSNDKLATTEYDPCIPGRKFWKSFKYPANNQWITVTKADVDAFWKLIDWGNIPDICSLPTTKREQRMFLYFVAMQLIESNLLDDKFRAMPCATFTGPLDALCIEIPLPLNVTRYTGSNLEAPVPSTTKNYKGELQTLASRLVKNPVIAYDTSARERLFVSTVSVKLIGTPQTFTGSPCTTKKAAEQSAAGQALQSFQSMK